MLKSISHIFRFISSLFKTQMAFRQKMLHFGISCAFFRVVSRSLKFDQPTGFCGVFCLDIGQMEGGSDIRETGYSNPVAAQTIQGALDSIV